MSTRRGARTNGIRFHRLRLELTQAQLAEMVGVTTKFVSFWETGRAEPSAERKALLSEVLTCHPDLLMKPIDKRLEKQVDVHKMRSLSPRRPSRYWMNDNEQDPKHGH